MQTLNCSSLPLSHLTLKVGVPVMILRNIYATEGLCNGTMAIVITLFQNTIEVTIISGIYQGRRCLIPRLTMVEEEEFHFTLQCWQFPIRLGFAMTFNKSQGQSLSHVGVDLTHDPFSHGQLYVALSCTTDVRGIIALIDPDHNCGQTQNVVYPEVLLCQAPQPE
ncbi:hypothetical protein DSO57_1039810 [Entomophthora muscae]|uniref:Uncharacterized protein n=1 Tax=Entomophthora muscae TaxID=34485 RepID=A0ACC2TFS6_9FUNG|nr:hypothetical protein DSO57_1039810 [Entomophthora muscae]